MKDIAQIEHRGIIKEINGNELQVSIINKSSCASCNIQGSCSVSDIDEKMIDVYTNTPQDYKLGDNVDVYFKQSLGFRALLLGYLYPFFVMLITMIVMLQVTERELLSGLSALGALIPYYLIVYYTKDRLKKTFSFSIKKSFVYPPHMSAVNI